MSLALARTDVIHPSFLQATVQLAGSAVRSAGARLAGSYANFYICNGGVVMPAFGGDAAETDKR